MDLNALTKEDYDYEKEVEAQVLEETLAQDSVYQRFRYVNFVSSSKGKDRKRSHLLEVELFHDTWDTSRPRYWHTDRKFKWDERATEALPNVDNSEAEQRLMNRVREICNDR